MVDQPLKYANPNLSPFHPFSLEITNHCHVYKKDKRGNKNKCIASILSTFPFTKLYETTQHVIIFLQDEFALERQFFQQQILSEIRSNLKAMCSLVVAAIPYFFLQVQ